MVDVKKSGVHFSITLRNHWAFFLLFISINCFFCLGIEEHYQTYTLQIVTGTHQVIQDSNNRNTVRKIELKTDFSQIGQQWERSVLRPVGMHGLNYRWIWVWPRDEVSFGDWWNLWRVVWVYVKYEFEFERGIKLSPVIDALTRGFNFVTI